MSGDGVGRGKSAARRSSGTRNTPCRFQNHAFPARHYIDTLTLAPGTAAVWRYRAIYLMRDEVFGQWSDVVSIAVTG